MKTTNNKKSKFLALLLSVMMLSSVGAALSACTDSIDSSSSSSSSSAEESTNDKVDNGTIKNSNFDFTNLTETVKIGTSVTGWSRSTNSVSTGSAPSSKSSSGVISVDKKKWDDLTTRKKSDEEIAAMEIKDAVAAWDGDNMTTADKLAFYEAWKDKNKKLDIDEEFDKVKKDVYQSFNIDYEDLPIAEGETVGLSNPGKPDGVEDSQILMIHNNATAGTAQKYTSSTTVTLSAGKAAKVSVWVKTADLKTVKTVGSDKVEQDAVGKGAYISVTQSVGGKSLDAFEVKNIRTDDVAEGEENVWKQYTFYLRSSSFADTKFSLVLGLGQDGGSNHFGYVNGYAFFDNIEYEELSLADYTTATANMDSVDLSAEKADKTIDAYSDNATKFAMDFHDSSWSSIDANETENETSGKLNKASEAKLTETSDGSNYDNKLPGDVKYDVMKQYANKGAIAAETSSNEYLEAVYNNFIKNDEEGAFLQDNDKILMMLSASGAPYTWENAYEFTMPQGVDYAAISFYVKTIDFKQGTGLTATLTNSESSVAFSGINTAIIEDVEETNDGWQRYYFFVEKDDTLKLKEEDCTFYLNLNYGPTSVSVSTAKTSFVSGFAAITRFEVLDMGKMEYSCAEEGTYTKLYTLAATEEEKAAGNAGFDTAASTPSDALENGLANAQNYKGVYSDSYYVNPNSTSENGYLVNSNKNAGLLNRDKFIENYASIIANPDNTAWVNALGLTAAMDPAEAWTKVFGNATQPLLIMNDGTNAYGYIGTSTTISSAYTLVSVRVKTTPGAKASVYLVDMDDATRQTMLSVSDNLVYWYDDNGNILTGNPDEKDSKIAFKLDKKTGLYKVNTKWSEAYTGYYANLSAYSKDGDGNLIANENSATHSYMDKDWDRIVFYAANGKYYADAAHTVEVKDLKDVAELTPRYEGGNSADLKLEGIDTNGEWKTITFYIKKGNAAKNYRLEVWSGTRDGSVKNAANSYVLFDTNNPGTASSLYADLMEEYKDDVADENKFESVFSYYDTDKHVRYEEAKDVDEVGNLYKDSFKASSYESAIAYMLYQKDGNYTVFADYSLSDVTVTPASADKDTDTDDDTTEETDEDGMNIFMLISSISVAAALLVAIGGIATQRILKVVRKKKAAKAHVNVVQKNK